MIIFDGDAYVEDFVRLRVDGPAFRYGFGLFETMLWNGRRPCRLEQHLARLYGSLHTLEIDFEIADFGPVVTETARRNGLEGKPGRVNIFYPVDTDPYAQDPHPVRPVVAAAPWSTASADAVLELAVSPKPLHTWLGAHKSMNYLYYYLEHRAATHAGAHGVVITSPDGNVLEAATAALVFSDGETFTTPAPALAGREAPGLLASTSLAAAREAVAIQSGPVPLAGLGEYRHAYTVSSLGGMLPVGRIADVAFAVNTAPVAAVNERIFMA